MARTLPLRESGSATVDSSGRAVVTVQPLAAFETWRVRRITVQNTGTVLVPFCRVYRGNQSMSGLVDGTFTGTMDTSDCDILLQSGEALIAVWEGETTGSAGADVGSSCVMTLEGTRERGV